jgi:hypothetical protein
MVKGEPYHGPTGSFHLQRIFYREVEKGRRKVGFIPENFFDFVVEF